MNPSIEAKIQEIRAILNTFDPSKAGEPEKGDEIRRQCRLLQVLVEDAHAGPLEPLPDGVKQIIGKLAEFERQVTNAAMGPGFTKGTTNREWLELADATLTEIKNAFTILS